MNNKKLYSSSDRSNTKKWYQKTMKGDYLAFFIVPLIFLILVFITAVIIVATQSTATILNQTETQFHVNAEYSNVPTKIFSNIYSFDTFLPFIFYMLMIAIIFSAVLLQPDTLSWLVGIVYMPLIYFVSVYISNAAHGILLEPAITNGVTRLPNSLVILANLPTITFLFGLLYLIALAIRVYTYKPTT